MDNSSDSDVSLRLPSTKKNLNKKKTSNKGAKTIDLFDAFASPKKGRAGAVAESPTKLNEIIKNLKDLNTKLEI